MIQAFVNALNELENEVFEVTGGDDASRIVELTTDVYNKLKAVGVTEQEIKNAGDDNSFCLLSLAFSKYPGQIEYDGKFRVWNGRKSINELVQEAHQNAVSKGWWDEDRSFGEIIALMHSEVSEALEDYRNGRDITEVWYENKELKTRLHDPITPNCKPCGIPSELADIVIRVFDAAGRYGIDLEKAITEKMAYNATRPHKHGGKVI